MSEIEFKTGVIHPVECMREGWELIKDQYWLFFGVAIVGGLIAGFSMYILLGAMFCGIYYCLFQKMNGQQAKFEELFKGFDYFMPSLIVALFFIVPNLVIVFLNFGFQIAVPIFIEQSGASPELIWSLFGIYGLVLLVLGILMACFHALIMFTFPLIVEYKLSGIEAFKLSAKSVWANLGGVVGIILCEFGLIFVGYLACCIGVLFVFPLMYAGTFVAYRKVFPAARIQNFNPPPPDAFQGAGSYT